MTIRPRKMNRFGNLLAEFVIDTWSYEGLISLIETNANTQESLNISQGEFEQQWLNHLNSRYDFSANGFAVSSDC